MKSLDELKKEIEVAKEDRKVKVKEEKEKQQKELLVKLSENIDLVKKAIEDKEIKFDTSKIEETLKEISEKEIEFPEPEKYPDEMKISNLKDIKFPEQKEVVIPDFPKEMEIKEPKWFNFKGILDAIVDLKNTIIKQPKVDVEKFKLKQNAVAVRLVTEDGGKFYNAGGGGHSVGCGFGSQESANLTALRTNTNTLIDGQGKWNGITSGLSKWKETDGKPRISSMPYTYDISEGNITGHEPWSKIGYNGDVDVGTEDMIGQGGVYVFPAAQGSMDIVSSSAEDDPAKPGAGTGVHTVTLYYLDNTFAEKTVDINLNGTVAVETSVSDIYRVQNMRAKVCGTGGAAAGNITLSEHAGTTYKYGYIALGQTRMRQCVYTVPKNKLLFINNIAFAVGGATKERCAVFTTLAKYDNKALAIRDFFLPYNEVIIEDDAYSREFEVPTKLPAGVDLKVQVRGLTADSVCTCSLRGWIETV